MHTQFLLLMSRPDVACKSSSALVSSACLGCTNHGVSQLKERNYLNASDSTSTESSTISFISKDSSFGLNLKADELGLNLKATELRLGLPRSQSPERDPRYCQLSTEKLDEKPLSPRLNNKCALSQKMKQGHKRRFSVAMIDFSEKKYVANSEVNAMPTDLSIKSVAGKINHGAHPFKKNEHVVLRNVSHVQTCTANKSGANCAGASSDNTDAPRAKQVTGWPSIRSFRKNTLATTTKNINYEEEEEEEKAKNSTAIYVKVSMDGAPYIRKVDLRAYSAYQDLSSCLAKMFSYFTIGQYGCEYVLTYENKAGDLMFFGDIPWEMFVNTCKRLRIMKDPNTFSLAPSNREKDRNKNLDAINPIGASLELNLCGGEASR